MKVTIQLPAMLRRHVDDQECVDVTATTVGEAIDTLCDRYEALRRRLLQPNRRLRPSIAIFVNNAQPRAKPDTTLSDGDTLVVLQPVGGG